MRFEIRSSSAFPDRTAAELRASLEELNTWVASTQTWHSAMRWLSPTCCVSRNERTAVGHDGEQYAWTRLYVFEVRDGRGVASCEFEVDDEEAAFAYAEERMQATASRLAVSNRASRTWGALNASIAGPRCRRRGRVLLGAACVRRPAPVGRKPASSDCARPMNASMAQYSEFEGRTLAVRGERLHLGWMRWSNESGFETAICSSMRSATNGRFVYRRPLRRGRLRGRLPRARATLLRRGRRGRRRPGLRSAQSGSSL